MRNFTVQRSFIHSFIQDIYIAPLQETYSEALLVQLRPKRNVLRSLQKEDTFRDSKQSVRGSSFRAVNIWYGPATPYLRSFIHSGYFYSTSSSSLLLRGAQPQHCYCAGVNSPKCYRQLWGKDLPKVPMWRVGFEHPPLWTQGTEITTEPPLPSLPTFFALLELTLTLLIIQLNNNELNKKKNEL